MPAIQTAHQPAYVPSQSQTTYRPHRTAIQSAFKSYEPTLQCAYVGSHRAAFSPAIEAANKSANGAAYEAAYWPAIQSPHETANWSAYEATHDATHWTAI